MENYIREDFLIGAKKRIFVLSSRGMAAAPAHVSLLALIETVFAVFIYWYISTKTESFSIIIISSFFAFFVLLRSDLSIRLGKVVFLKFVDGPSPSLAKSNLIICSALGLGSVLATASVLSLSNFSYKFSTTSIVIAWIVLFLNLFITSAVFMSGSMSKVGGIALAVSRMLNLRKQAEERKGNIRATTGLRWLRAVGLVLLGVGFALGIFLRTLVTRVYATLRYLFRGIEFFPKNWLDLIVWEDFFKPPALVPGLPVDHYLHPTTFLSRRNLSIDEWAYIIVFFPIIIVPSWLYRLTLKSTFWLYAPVAWIAYIPERLRTEEDKVVWIQHAGKKLYDWFVFVSALAVLSFSLITAFDPFLYKQAKEVTDDYFWTPLHLIFAFDAQNLKIWHLVTIPSASLTLLLVIWSDSIRKRMNAGCIVSSVSAEIRGLLAVNQAKNLFTALWIIVTLWSFTVSAWALGHFPEWLERFVRSIVHLFAESLE